MRGVGGGLTIFIALRRKQKKGVWSFHFAPDAVGVKKESERQSTSLSSDLMDIATTASSICRDSEVHKKGSNLCSFSNNPELR